MASAAAPWWESLYDLEMAAALFPRERARLELEVDALVRHLALEPGQRVFDQCCGVGTLSAPLVARGYEILGVEQAAAYVEAARVAAGSGRAEFVAEDARVFRRPGSCDAGFCWGTSYGNADDAGNQAMLRAAFDTLRPGARYLVEFANLAFFLSRWEGCRTRHSPGTGTQIFRESRLDLERGRLDQTWTIVPPDAPPRRRETSVALYLPHQLAANLRRAGFVDVELFGDLDAQPITRGHGRCLCVGRRP
ncbi:MAG: class I SAM-dependent methyltransferase [Nannocystaceae bacterium]